MTIKKLRENSPGPTSTMLYPFLSCLHKMLILSIKKTY